MAVKDLEKSKKFFEGLGFAFDPRFTGNDAASLVIDEGHIYAMLIAEPRFREFVTKDVSDARTAAQAIFALRVESRDAADRMANTAVKLGGRASSDPEDHGWLYSRPFEDVDGHVWEAFWMDESLAPKDTETEKIDQSNNKD